MVKDLVLNAVKIKMNCTTRNDLISKAEYSCAVGIAFRSMKRDKDDLQSILKMTTISEIKASIVEIVRIAYEQPTNSESEAIKTLFHMLLECKIDGEMSEELQEVMLMGYENG